MFFFIHATAPDLTVSSARLFNGGQFYICTNNGVTKADQELRVKEFHRRKIEKLCKDMGESDLNLSHLDGSWKDRLKLDLERNWDFELRVASGGLVTVQELFCRNFPPVVIGGSTLYPSVSLGSNDIFLFASKVKEVGTVAVAIPYVWYGMFKGTVKGVVNWDRKFFAESVGIASKPWDLELQRQEKERPYLPEMVRLIKQRMQPVKDEIAKRKSTIRWFLSGSVHEREEAYVKVKTALPPEICSLIEKQFDSLYKTTGGMHYDNALEFVENLVKFPTSSKDTRFVQLFEYDERKPFKYFSPEVLSEIEGVISSISAKENNSSHTDVKVFYFWGEPAHLKTAAAQGIAEVLGLPYSIKTFGTSNNAFTEVTGTNYRFLEPQLGWVFDALMEQTTNTKNGKPMNCLNPILIIDEIDFSDLNSQIIELFKNLFTSKQVAIPYMNGYKFDFRKLTIICTSNVNPNRINLGLRSRMKCIEFPKGCIDPFEVITDGLPDFTHANPELPTLTYKQIQSFMSYVKFYLEDRKEVIDIRSVERAARSIVRPRSQGSWHDVWRAYIGELKYRKYQISNNYFVKQFEELKIEPGKAIVTSVGSMILAQSIYWTYQLCNLYPYQMQVGLQAVSSIGFLCFLYSYPYKVSAGSVGAYFLYLYPFFVAKLFLSLGLFGVLFSLNPYIAFFSGLALLNPWTFVWSIGSWCQFLIS